MAVPCEDCATKVQHRGRQRYTLLFRLLAGWPMHRGRVHSAVPSARLGPGAALGRPGIGTRLLATDLFQHRTSAVHLDLVLLLESGREILARFRLGERFQHTGNYPMVFATL